ncbi:AimR family lysis-lysogeny pheromone receptor [Bacillus altitudinis]|uniref:AimR family lysis-lysogeny pheromone receptor n=1 Tax=Bacillus altitudinis TaxID=293387 RepID=A0ABV1S3Z6_BACAB
MLSIRDDVFNTMEDRDLSLETAASILEVHVNSLYNFKKSGSIGFRSLLKLAQLLYRKDYHDKMREWCLLLPTTEAIKHAFEYAAIKRDTDLLEDLLENAEGDVSLQDYSSVYGLIHGYMTDAFPYTELKNKVSAVKIKKDKDLTVLLEIYGCYALYFDKNFLNILEKSKGIRKNIESLKGDRKLFFKECYLFRVSEILMPVNLHFSNYEEARYFAEIIFFADISSKSKADASYVIGMSYLNVNREECLKNLALSLDLIQTIGNAQLTREAETTLNIAKMIFDAKDGCLNADPLELASELRLGHDSDFIRYFEFRMAGDIGKLYEGFSFFIERMNFLFAELIADDLGIFGVDARQVNALKSIKIIKKGDVSFEKSLISCFSCGDRYDYACI